MSAERQSIHSIQNMVSEKPSETSMWHHLGKLEMEEIEEINNEVLVEPIKDTIPKDKPCRFVIDYTDDPYYGQITPENEEFVVGGKLKKSTTRFYRFATLYLFTKHRKITLSILPVQNGKTHIYYLKRFLGVIYSMGLQIEVLLLDRGFYSSIVFSYLQENDIPYITPVKYHSKEMKRLLKGRRSRYGNYTMGGAKGPIELKIAIAVKYLKGRYGKNKAMNYGYVVYGIDWKPHKVAKVYEKRFSIESSYRMRNIVRARTTTKNPTIRYLMALISMLLKNVWAALRWRFFSRLKRGPRTVDEDAFRFDQFRIVIWDVFVRKLGLRRKIPTLRPYG